MDQVNVVGDWNAHAKQNKGTSRSDRDYEAADFSWNAGNPQSTHGRRIREGLNSEGSSRKQKGGPSGPLSASF